MIVATAIPGLIVTSVVCTAGTWLLVECKVSMKDEGPKVESACGNADDGDAAEVEDAAASDCTASADRPDFGLGPMAEIAYGLFGRGGLFVVGAALISSQVGCCIAYVDVLVETIDDLLDHRLPLLWLRCGLCALLCALSLVRGLTKLAWLAAAALLVYTFVAYALLKYGIQEISAGRTESWEDALRLETSGLGEFLGTAIFAFEGVALAPYVFDSMRLENPRPFLWVLVSANVTAFIIYAFVGVFGFTIYGHCVKDIIYENFPPESMDVMVVQIVLCVVLLLTYVLQMYPVYSCLEANVLGVFPDGHAVSHEELEPTDGYPPAVVGVKAADGMVPEIKRPSAEKDTIGLDANRFENASSWTGSSDHPRAPSYTISILSPLLRGCVVVATFAVAAAVPNLSSVTGYVGAFSMGTIGFVFPGIAHIRVHGKNLTPMQWICDAVVISVGLAAMAFQLTRHDDAAEAGALCNLGNDTGDGHA